MTLANFEALSGGKQLFQLFRSVFRRGVPVNKSLTLDGTSQTLSAANASRSYLNIQNKSTNSTIWVNISGAAATADSPNIEVPAGRGLAFSNGAIPSTAITVIGTTGDKVTAWEF